MRNRTNLKVRACLMEHGMAQWQLADILRIADNTMSKYMRYEWSEEFQEQMCGIIKGEKFDYLEVRNKLRSYVPKREVSHEKIHDEEWYAEQYAKYVCDQVKYTEELADIEGLGRIDK